VELTGSYRTVLPHHLLGKYAFLEVRNAAAVLQASNAGCFADVVAVLDDFFIYDDDITVAGGNRSTIPQRLDGAFFDLGWNAVRVDTEFKLHGKMKQHYTNRAYTHSFLDSLVANKGYEVDNMKDRVALDVEWNAKDGNLDRDLTAYRMLYDLGLIDCAVIILRDYQGILDLANIDLRDHEAARRLGTNTGTTVQKLQDRLTRGDGGGCPVLAVGMTRATWAGLGVPIP